jgi:hypothetical protein
MLKDEITDQAVERRKESKEFTKLMKFGLSTLTCER